MKKSDRIEILSRYNRAEVSISKVEQPLAEARLAMELIARWGLVAAAPDGEDSSGRSKARLQTPEELVTGACETAERAFIAFRTRGWMLDVPSLSEAREELVKQGLITEDEPKKKR